MSVRYRANSNFKPKLRSNSNNSQVSSAKSPTNLKPRRKKVSSITSQSKKPSKELEEPLSKKFSKGELRHASELQTDDHWNTIAGQARSVREKTWLVRTDNCEFESILDYLRGL